MGKSAVLLYRCVLLLYRCRLARLYHPDKTGGGGGGFGGGRAATGGGRGGGGGGQGPQPWRVLLILRAQCVLFRRCPEVLAPFK
jgi:DnaJ family protein C protein 13